MSPAATNPDDDPVIAEYDVFITPDLLEQLYLFQYPNRERDQPYNNEFDQAPTSMRMKPKSGFIELEVPTATDINFDKRKSIVFGDAQRRAAEAKVGGFGLPSGFDAARNAGSMPIRTKSGDKEESHTEKLARLTKEFDESNKKGVAYTKQVLTGQVTKHEEGDPMYMLGTFKENQLHLTKLTGIVQMRPQFNHVDAVGQMDRLDRRREMNDPPKTTEPRAVQTTVRSLDQENWDANQVAALLKEAREESWVKVQFNDADSPEAYNVYNEKLFLRNPETAPKLRSSMTADEYLDAISAPTHSSRHRVRKRSKKGKTAREDSDLSASEAEGGDVDMVDAPK